MEIFSKIINEFSTSKNYWNQNIQIWSSVIVVQIVNYKSLSDSNWRENDNNCACFYSNKIFVQGTKFSFGKKIWLIIILFTLKLLFESELYSTFKQCWRSGSGSADPGSGSAYFYRDSDPQKIRNNFHVDLIFADLKYTFKIWAKVDL